jgi:hypothetical protein
MGTLRAPVSLRGVALGYRYGVLSRKSVSELLTTLDAPGALALDAEIERHRDWSGDPYNRR